MFFRYVNGQEQSRNSLLLNRRGELVMNNVEREVLSTWFISLSADAVELQTLGTKIQVGANTDPLLVKELVWEL